jgi:hypothetical protein
MSGRVNGEPNSAPHGPGEILAILAILLIVGWLLGVLSTYTWGGGIHLLLVFAAIAIVVQYVRNRGSNA